MIDYLILFLTNVAYIVFRAFEIRAVSGNKPFLAAISQTFLTLIWLITVTFGLKSVIQNDYYMWAAYIVSAAIGTAFGTWIKRSPSTQEEAVGFTPAQLELIKTYMIASGKFTLRHNPEDTL